MGSWTLDDIAWDRFDPAAYARILAGAYRGAKRADPYVTVVSAAPSQRTGGLGGTMEDIDWLNGLYDAGAAASFDALGVHAYLGNFDPTTDPSSQLRLHAGAFCRGS